MRVINMFGTRALPLFFLVMAVLSVGFTGCGSSPQGIEQGQADPATGGIPELTKEIIDERINEARVYEVKPESGTGEPIPWSFDEDEPKEIVIVDKQIDGTRGTIVLDIKTKSSPRARTQRHLAGQIRTDWELRTGWVLRRWEIINTENISMKYRDMPKNAPPENANR